MAGEPARCRRPASARSPLLVAAVGGKGLPAVRGAGTRTASDRPGSGRKPWRGNGVPGPPVGPPGPVCARCPGQHPPSCRRARSRPDPSCRQPLCTLPRSCVVRQSCTVVRRAQCRGASLPAPAVPRQPRFHSAVRRGQRHVRPLCERDFVLGNTITRKVCFSSCSFSFSDMEKVTCAQEEKCTSPVSPGCALPRGHGKAARILGECSLGGSADGPEVLDRVAKLAQQLIREELWKKERRGHQMEIPRAVGAWSSKAWLIPVLCGDKSSHPNQ